MTKAMRYCKCGKRYDVYGHFYNKVTGNAIYVHSCSDHFKEDVKAAIDSLQPSIYGKIKN